MGNGGMSPGILDYVTGGRGEQSSS